MLRAPRPSRLTRSLVAVILGAAASSTSSLAHAQAPPATAPSSQKPPCVPASSYMLGYDCELFPLPSAASAPTAAAVVPVAVVPVAVVPVAVAPLPGGAGAVVPAEGVPTPAAPPEGEAVAVVAVPPPPAAPPVDATGGDQPSHAPAYVAFAVGVAGIGMTVAFGILALQTKSTLNDECGGGHVCPSSAASDVSSLKTDDNLADVGLGVAVAGVAVGAILFATEHRSSTTTGRRHIEPWIGLGSAGLKGSF